MMFRRVGRGPWELTAWTLPAGIPPAVLVGVIFA